MSRYEELRDAFNKQEEAAIAYWQGLQIKAEQITEGLSQYLEYPEKDYLDPDNKIKKRYIYMTKRGEKEKVRHFTDLEGARGAIDFDIIITLECAAGIFPKSLYRLAMHIGAVDGLLRVWSDTSGVSADIVPTQPSSYEVLYQQIFTVLKAQLEVRPSLE
ncbi:hypothetical protein [Pseudomonas sp. JAI120]|uniref:hypothetical protein n=1 Tax=Pseudomonas sp. JAI120 TaxID=2723063 RepID=UPI0030D6F256